MTPHKKRKAVKREKAKRLGSGVEAFNFSDAGDAVAFHFSDAGMAERFPVVWTNVTDSESFEGLLGPLMAALEDRDVKA